MKKLLLLLSGILTLGTVCAYAAEPAVSYSMNDAKSSPAANGTVTYSAGVSGDAARLSDNAYLSLPTMTMPDEYTISAWVKPESVDTWSRVFDFGTGTQKYMFLTLSNGSNTVFAVTNNYSGAEQKITAPIAFKTGEWTHIAVTRSGSAGIMYVNGVEAGRNDEMTISSAQLGSLNKNYIGKSQYNDPYFSGMADEVEIYSSALSPSGITALATPDSDRIASVEAEIKLTTDLDTPPELPETVEAALADGSKCHIPVKWEEYDSSRLSEGGVFTVSGDAGGNAVTAEINVNGLVVTPSVSMDEAGQATARFDVINKTDIDKAIIYLAVYDEGVLKNVSLQKIDKLETGTYSLSADISGLEEPMAKSFIWDTELRPLADAATFRNTAPTGSSFEVSEVRLTDGIFKTSQDLGREYIMQLDPDRLLAPVAYSTGATTDRSKYYGGWEAYRYRSYTGNGISGHSLGHWLSAMSTMYAATGDGAVKERLDYAVGKLAEYQNDDGYVGGVQKTDLVNSLKAGTVNAGGFELNGYWVPWYSFHKIYQGLIDAYELTGNNTALDVAVKFADWGIDVTSELSDAKFSQMLECEYGGMNEVYAELYKITGEQKYMDMAVKFSQKAILEPLSNGIDELQGKHANTQIPKIIGAASVYEQDLSRTDYMDAVSFFFDTVVNRRSYVIGGNANREHFGSLTDETLGPQTLETCNTYNMMKLAEHLYSWNHNPEYMDYYEKALFNHILASQDPETGEKTYFMATTPGHFKVYSDALNGHSFWCCNGSGMENPGRYTRDIYYKDGSTFYVNQFISSEVTWKEKGLVISQTTDYPYEDTTVIKVESGSADARMKIRIPSWIAGDAEIRINGGETVRVSETGYYTIEREWAEGDTVEVRLPMALHIYTARDDEHKAAFMYGPVVLAGALGTDTFPASDRVDDHTSLDNFTKINVPDIIVNDKDPETFIKAKDLSKLEFELSGIDGTVVTLIPYADLHHERYSLYWMLYSRDESIEKDEFTEALDAVTTDTVYPNEQQPEVDHGMLKNNSDSGYFSEASRGWRDALGADGFFSYEMKVNAEAEHNYVMALYWGGDVPFKKDGVSYTREFEILADETVIGEETLNNSSPGKLMYKYYEIPASVLTGKEKVTVKFRPKGANKAAGGVFEVRTTTDKVEK